VGNRAQQVSIDVLGPLRAIADGGRDVTPTGVLQRRLLSLLVLHRGQLVSTDAAIEALWPGALPADPAAALQNHMSRLRRLLPGELIASVGDGYRIDPGVLDVDADRLGRFVAEGASPEDVQAILGRWRGPAYVDLADCDAAVAEAVRLEELRIRALEICAEARLAAGDTDGLVAELHALVDAAPLRERPRALLIETLVSTGRQAEALRVYDDFRRVLGTELGIEPSAALTARHTELLAGRPPERVGAIEAGWAPATRLVHPAASLIGREQFLEEADQRIRAGRLVTLVGAGGVGKTRLLVELGHRLLAEQPTRPVVLCELAIGDAASAVEVVAAALGVDARPGVRLADRVADVLGPAVAVLLFDNCEHVIEPVAALAEQLLARCPHVRIVATSRERLRVAGEHVLVVPTLGLGDVAAPAVQLFVERARAVCPGFEPDRDALERIAGIVARLDGLPLAIELAAARLHTHDLDEVAAGLDDRFAMLTAGHRTSARHGSLAAAVAWSFGLLPPDLQETFADLAVFAGPFTADDAAAVAGISAADAARVLVELLERSLVMRAPGRRYMLLETLRAFGLDQLQSTGRATIVAERHADHQAAWLAGAHRRLLEPGNDALPEIEAALPELRSALGWALERGRTDLAGRLAVHLLDYGFFRLRPDVLAWTERVLAADPVESAPLAAGLGGVGACAAWMDGDLPECGRRSWRAWELAEQAGGPLTAHVLTAQASFELFEGDLAAAADHYHQAAEQRLPSDPARSLVAAASEILARSYARDDVAAAELAAALLERVPDDTCYAAYAWYCAGEADMVVDPARARQRLSRAIALAERTGASFVYGVAGASKASLDARSGDAHEAAADYRRLILHWRRAGVWSTQWTMLRSIAALLARLGRFHDAAVLEGAIRATLAGHRIFGDDEVALGELSATLLAELGEDAYAAARRAGAGLDGDAAVEHALAVL
jgi:predicted ATPase/DNA-binding SARP family transcriptional activator